MSLSKELGIAQSYYDNAMYQTVLDKCLEIIGTAKAEDPVGYKEIIKKSHMLFAKAMMQYSMAAAGTLLDDSLTAACKAFGYAAGYADSLEDLFAMEQEALAVNEECERTFIVKQLAELVTAPSLQKLQELHSGKGCYIGAQLNIFSAFNTHDNAIALAEVEGLTVQEASEKYYREPDNAFTETEKNHLYKEAADRIFATACKNFENCSTGTAEFVKAAIAAPLMQILVAETLYENCIPRDKSKITEEHLEYLIAEVNVKLYNLSMYVSTPGGKVSVHRSTRQELISQMNKLCEIIRRLDPEFVPPTIPSEVYSPTQTTSASGGCYVATAVYGSYDCPQVWTLRRYRDDTLASTWYGRAFIQTYYAISPILVKRFGHANWFKKFWKGKLDKMVANLQEKGFEATPYEDKNW